MSGMCECDNPNCMHRGHEVPAHDHGDVRASPELCMACLFCCTDEED